MHLQFFIFPVTILYYLTLTTNTMTTVVEPSLDSGTQPGASEHAVPLTSTPFNSALVAGM